MLGRHALDLLAAHAQAMLEFGEYVHNDKDNQDDAVTKSLVALLGDLASNVSGVGPAFAQKAYVQHIIQARHMPRVLLGLSGILRCEPLTYTIPGNLKIKAMPPFVSHDHARWLHSFKTTTLGRSALGALAMWSPPCGFASLCALQESYLPLKGGIGLTGSRKASARVHMTSGPDAARAMCAGGAQLPGPLPGGGRWLGIHSHQQGRAASRSCSPAAVRAPATRVPSAGECTTASAAACWPSTRALQALDSAAAPQHARGMQSQPCVAVSEQTASLGLGGTSFARLAPADA